MCNHELRASPPPLTAPLNAPLNVSVAMDDGNHVVNVSGALDMGIRDFVEQACLASDDIAVVVEMADLTFMDCCGYGALASARRVLQERGGSLTLSHQAGQPARLLALLGVVEPV